MRRKRKQHDQQQTKLKHRDQSATCAQTHNQRRSCLQGKAYQECIYITECLIDQSWRKKHEDALQSDASKGGGERRRPTLSLSIYLRRSRPSLHSAKPNGFGGHDNTPTGELWKGLQSLSTLTRARKAFAKSFKSNSLQLPSKFG